MTKELEALKCVEQALKHYQESCSKYRKDYQELILLISRLFKELDIHWSEIDYQRENFHSEVIFRVITESKTVLDKYSREKKIKEITDIVTRLKELIN